MLLMIWQVPSLRRMHMRARRVRDSTDKLNTLATEYFVDTDRYKYDTIVLKE